MEPNSTPEQGLEQTRICENCGCEFKSRNARQKYHSPSCEKKAYSQRNGDKIRARQRELRAADPEKYRAMQRRYRRRNAEKIRAQGRIAYARNAERRRAQERARRAADPEKYRAWQREYRAQNREKVRVRQREYYAADQERYRGYARLAYKKHPDKIKARSLAWRAAQRQVVVDLTAEVEELRALRNAGMLSPKKDVGGRPEGMTEERQKKARELLRYIQEFIDKNHHDDGSIAHAAKKAYPNVALRTAKDRANKTLKDYRNFVKAQKPSAS
jgi:hypothetical protein